MSSLSFRHLMIQLIVSCLLVDVRWSPPSRGGFCSRPPLPRHPRVSFASREKPTQPFTHLPQTSRFSHRPLRAGSPPTI